MIRPRRALALTLFFTTAACGLSLSPRASAEPGVCLGHAGRGQSPPPTPGAAELRGPPTAARLAGDATAYEPYARATFGAKCMQLELPLSLAGRLEGVSGFPLDRFGDSLGARASASPEVRAGARFSSGLDWAPFALLAEAEVDALTGTAAADPRVAAPGVLGTDGLTLQLRKLHARASLGPSLHLDVGAQTSHFGMGLLANDGAHGWEPGSAVFVDPRRGDRVLRAQLATGPLSAARIVASVGVDKVLGDDLLLEGDSARQAFGALLVGFGEPLSAGAYVVRRHQESAAGRATDVTVADLTAKATVRVPGATLGLETEWALITGTTQLGATPERPTHDVLSLGGAARASLDMGAVGSVLDFLYASGDQNGYDGAQNAFQVDPNFGYGLLLFRHVVASQTARASALAGDPQLVGTAQDVERLPTRGAATNTVALFPRLRVRPIAGLEVYGGPLFALANVPSTDPFNARITGGAPRSALGGPAARALGAEVDVGVRYRALFYGQEVTLGVEAGALFPGAAFTSLEGARMGAVGGGRGMLRWRF